MQGALGESLVKELHPTCLNEEFSGHNYKLFMPQLRPQAAK